MVTLIDGVRLTQRRGIAFLESDTDDELDARKEFNRLSTNERRNLLSRMEHWLNGFTCDKYFHGWPNIPERKDLFTFKLTRGRLHLRFYGFLFHPRVPVDSRFQVCILVSHAQKNTRETDPAELRAVQRVKSIEIVLDAVKAAFLQKTKKGGSRGETLDRRN